MTVRVLEKYKSEVVPALRARFAYKNPMMMPKIVKVVINIGVGDAKSDSKFIDAAAAELATISGQRATVLAASDDQEVEEVHCELQTS